MGSDVARSGTMYCSITVLKEQQGCIELEILDDGDIESDCVLRFLSAEGGGFSYIICGEENMRQLGAALLKHGQRLIEAAGPELARAE